MGLGIGLARTHDARNNTKERQQSTSQRPALAFSVVDYINEASLIIRVRVNRSVIEHSNSSAAQVFDAFMCLFPTVERCRNEETSMKLCSY